MKSPQSVEATGITPDQAIKSSIKKKQDGRLKAKYEALDDIRWRLARDHNGKYPTIVESWALAAVIQDDHAWLVEQLAVDGWTTKITGYGLYSKAIVNSPQSLEAARVRKARPLWQKVKEFFCGEPDAV